MCDAMSQGSPIAPSEFSETCRLIAQGILSLPSNEQEAHLTTMQNANPVQASMVRTQMDLIRFGARQLHDEATTLANRLLGMPTAGRTMVMQQMRETQPALYSAVRAVLQGIQNTVRHVEPVHNPASQFFYTSHVNRPADRVAFNIPDVDHPADLRAFYGLDAADLAEMGLPNVTLQSRHVGSFPGKVAGALVLLSNNDWQVVRRRIEERSPVLHAAVLAHLNAFALDPNYFATSRWENGQPIPLQSAPPATTGSPIPDTDVAELVSRLSEMGVTPEMLEANAGVPDPPISAVSPRLMEIFERASGSPLTDPRMVAQVNLFTQQRMAEGTPPQDGPPRLPEFLTNAFSDYMRVVEERNRQRVRDGDWVSLTPNNGLFAKLPPHSNRTQMSDMRPGKPLVHTGIVTSVSYEMDNHSGIMQERITMECSGKTHRGRRTMPGATDNDLLLPCAHPSCARPHINGHPFCRDHRNDQPGENVLAYVSTRLDNLRQVREDRSTPPEIKTAVEADMDMLHQFVTDRTHAIRRAQQTEARRRRTLQEQARIQALADEQKERELLARLMEKHGVVAQPKPGPAITDGERNLEL